MHWIKEIIFKFEISLSAGVSHANCNSGTGATAILAKTFFKSFSGTTVLATFVSSLCRNNVKWMPEKSATGHVTWRQKLRMKIRRATGGQKSFECRKSRRRGNDNFTACSRRFLYSAFPVPENCVHQMTLAVFGWHSTFPLLNISVSPQARYLFFFLHDASNVCIFTSRTQSLDVAKSPKRKQNFCSVQWRFHLVSSGASKCD